MDTLSFYTQQLHQHCPNLQLQTLTLNQTGQYNDVLIVNGDLIFRFARVSAAASTLQRELALLRYLQGRLPLAIPNPIIPCAQPGATDVAFMGYRMLPGKPLWREDFATIATQHGDTIACQLAGFLYALHHTPAPSITLPLADTRQEWAELYARIQAQLFGYLHPKARRQVAQHFESFLANPNQSTFQPTLRHGDFGTSNILYDPESASVTGIIDFSSAGLGDPAVDFAALLASYGEAFYAQCCPHYPEMEHALNRVRFYRGTFALQEALFGIENDDPVALRNGLASVI